MSKRQYSDIHLKKLPYLRIVEKQGMGKFKT